MKIKYFVEKEEGIVVCNINGHFPLKKRTHVQQVIRKIRAWEKNIRRNKTLHGKIVEYPISIDIRWKEPESVEEKKNRIQFEKAMDKIMKKIQLYGEGKKEWVCFHNKPHIGVSGIMIEDWGLKVYR